MWVLVVYLLVFALVCTSVWFFSDSFIPLESNDFISTWEREIEYWSQFDTKEAQERVQYARKLLQIREVVLNDPSQRDNTTQVCN